MYSEKNILEIYKKNFEKEVDSHKVKNILPKIYLITKNYSMDEIDLLNIVDTLIEFNDNNMLDKINEETIKLLKTITASNDIKEDVPYFSLLLKHLLLPFYLNKCDSSYNLSVFLNQFDCLTDLMSINLDDNELEIVKKYNLELYELVKNYKLVINDYENSDLYKYSSLNDKLVINTTLSHLKTMLYFNLSMFEYKYELVKKVFNNIISNYVDYLYECSQYDIYSDSINLRINPKNVLNEYKLCFDLIKQEYNPPIKIKRR